MDELVLATELGRSSGSRSSRRLRREGRVPGVVYGLGSESVPVTVDFRELRGALTTEAGLNAIINLDVAGDTQLSIVKEVQRHPVRQEVLHVDFLRVDPDEEVEVDVPIVMVGEAPEVTQADGIVDQALFSLPVLAKPGSIPNELTVDISWLTVGASVRVSDIALPEGVRSAIEPEEAVASGVITRSTLEAIAEDEAAEAAALAEAEGIDIGEGEDGEEGAAEDGGAPEAGGDDE
jgi:large subunit ribosomal protein L25